ncbi:MAG: hypothetical protein AB1609_16440 [Bacillota bacterium]
MFTSQPLGEMEVQVVDGMTVVLIPEALREKLGAEAAKELVDLINVSTRATKDSVTELMVERFERRVAETEARLEKRLADLESRLTWKIFGFWAGQILVMVALLEAFFRFFLR